MHIQVLIILSVGCLANALPFKFHLREKRQTPPTDPFDINALRQMPEYKVAVEKIQEILKRPEYMNFLKSDQFQKFMEPANLKEFVQSEDFKKLQEPATIQQLMRTPTFINLISTPDVIQLLEKTKTGPFIAKLPQLAPRLLQALQTRILSGGSIPSANSIIQVAQG